MMMLAAAWLADMAPLDSQSRIIGRHAFLWADSLSLWLGRWRNQLKRSPSTSRLAKNAEPIVRELRQLVERHSSIRDSLAAKRQDLHLQRDRDLEETLLLYLSVNAEAVAHLANTGVRAYDLLSSAGPLGEDFPIDPALAERVQESLHDESATGYFFSANTYASAQDDTFPVAQGGELGRRIAQINDLASHLDVFLPLVPAVRGYLAFDWLVRSALLVELSALLDISIGPSPKARSSRKQRSLLEICRAGRSEVGATELERLRSSIEDGGWTYLRWARNKVGAHLDDELTVLELNQHLIQLDLPGIVRVAEFAWDWLDAVACVELDLQLLLFRATVRSEVASLSLQTQGPGTIAANLARHDSPYMVFAGGGALGGPAVAGMLSGRRPRARAKIEVPMRISPLELIARPVPDVERALARAKPKV
jgi:hypothetical protein